MNFILTGDAIIQVPVSHASEWLTYGVVFVAAAVACWMAGRKKRGGGE